MEGPSPLQPLFSLLEAGLMMPSAHGAASGSAFSLLCPSRAIPRPPSPSPRSCAGGPPARLGASAGPSGIPARVPTARPEPGAPERERGQPPCLPPRDSPCTDERKPDCLEGPLSPGPAGDGAGADSAWAAERWGWSPPVPEPRPRPEPQKGGARGWREVTPGVGRTLPGVTGCEKGPWWWVSAGLT